MNSESNNEKKEFNGEKRREPGKNHYHRRKPDRLKNTERSMNAEQAANDERSNNNEKAQNTEHPKNNGQLRNANRQRHKEQSKGSKSAEPAQTANSEVRPEQIEAAEPVQNEPEISVNMINVVGVRFKQNGKVYYFDPLDFDLKPQDGVIVETVRGTEYGFITSIPHKVVESELTSSLKPIIRIATDEDNRRLAENKEKEKNAFDTCLEKIAEHGLDMKLVDVEYTFDGKKILFYFTSDGRVDFRELVKDLAGIYRTRIELRQIGVRDETRTMGGIGICGREFCCHTFQPDFQPVSIRMAKDQNLSLNPSKIYGACGRLMCCIRYEEETYKELNKNLPKVGDETVTEDGLHGVVNAVNILRQKIKVIVDLGNDEKEVREYEPGTLKFTKRNRKSGKQAAPTPEELQIMEDLKKDN